jgi:hypothetical protein
MNTQNETPLSKCCDAPLMHDLDPEKSYFWSEVAEAPEVCEVCGLLDEPETPNTETVLLDMLTENTGVHGMDSGGDSGRAWQRNQALGRAGIKASPAARMGDYAPELSTFHFLNETVTYAPVLDLSLRGFMQKSNDSYREDIANWLDFLGIDPEIEGSDFYTSNRYEFNTYNNEYCLLDQALQFTIFTLNKVDYVALQIHGGADIRGGYTAPRVFKADREELIFGSESALMVCTNCELGLNFHAEGVEEYQQPTKHAKRWAKKSESGTLDLRNFEYGANGCPNCGAESWAA